MKLIKLTGVALLVLSGYLIHGLFVFNLSTEGSIFIGFITAALLALGISAVFASDKKSFKEHVKDILDGFLNGFLPYN